MSTKKIGVVGLGLLGGSIEKRLKSKGYEVLAVSKSQGRNTELKDLSSCEIVFLCGPQFEILKQLEEIAQITSKSGEAGKVPENERAFANTLITDIASTKKLISEKAESLSIKNFIGGHPMAGSEKTGYEASTPDLFENCNWILTEESEALRKIINDLGTENIIIMDADTHDESVAAISHLSFLLSYGLANGLREYPHAQKVLGPSFKEMTRLANGNVEMHKEIVIANREKIKKIWRTCKSFIDGLTELPSSGLKEEMEAIKKTVKA